MAEPKPFSPYEEQLSILRGRGLAIPDEELALQWLREKNYYRLSAYSLTLRQRDTATGNDKFFDGASFSDIIDLYEFDDQFRAAIFHAASVVETNLMLLIIMRGSTVLSDISMERTSKIPGDMPNS